MKKIIIALGIALCCNALHAQAPIEGIEIRLPDINNEADQKLLQQRAKECVKQMNNYISSMTAKQINGHPTWQDRYKFREAALELFLNNGDSIELNNGIKGAPVMMETTSANTSGRTIKTTRPVKVYFTRLLENIIKKGIYTEVIITSTDIEVMDVTNIKKVGDRYQCVVSYSQDFIGRRGEITTYADRTKKTITVWFIAEKTIWGDELVPKLGDIAAGETQRLYK
ncbi:MAG: hypothetical protein PUC50_01350 [Bacteroidales bacterium]|nr:hypothetical protein [Bacteroidales bacterium]